MEDINIGFYHHIIIILSHITYGLQMVREEYAGIGSGVRPSVYLKPSVKITTGSGSRDNPYILEV